MSVEANVTAAKRILEEAFNQGRLEVFDEVCSQDVVTHYPAELANLHGIEAHKERVRGYRAAMPDLRVHVRRHVRL